MTSTTYLQWLNQQFDKPQSEKAVDWMVARGYTAINSQNLFDVSYSGEYALWRSIFKSPDGVRKRMALALTEFFVVSFKGVEDWKNFQLPYFWDLLNEGAFGSFRTLLGKVTLSPAMGNYLNMRGNQKEDAATGRQPDENYARELMQLFTIGLYELNPDGTERLVNGEPILTYTQDDITNLARVLTGWDRDARGLQYFPNGQGTPENPRLVRTYETAIRPMIYSDNKHSKLPAYLLGSRIDAGGDGPAALTAALNVLFNHPNVGPFFGKQLIQRLVTSNPSPAYVARVTAAFNNNGNGVRGDLKAVLRAVLLDVEALSDDGITQPGYGKLREPMVRFIQWGRSFKLNSVADSWKLPDQSSSDKLGQSPLNAPSVFNFFRPGYVPPGTALAANKIPAPEFQILNETTVSTYVNYMQGVVKDGFNINDPTNIYRAYSNAVRDIVPDYSAEFALVTDAGALVARLNLILCANQLSAATVTTIVTALNATPVTAASSDTVKRNRIGAAVLLVMASPEYLIQK